MVNKKADADIGELLMNQAIYIILTIIFFAGMMLYLSQYKNNAALWEDFYAKELSKTINLASPGDQITLNIQQPLKIALKNQIKTFSETFTFDNSEKEICVKLSPNKETCYYYFNNVDIENPEINRGIVEEATLTFKIVEAKK